MDILAAVVLVALLVFIHEFGHFVVAKACGVAVPVFSIGFGRRLFGVQIGGTDYRVSALPFGGYVRMAGADPFGYEDEEDELEDPATAFSARPVWQRLAVMMAGPGFNLALPFVVFTILFMLGEPRPAADVGYVMADSAAESAGVLSGDRVRSVGGVDVASWTDLDDALSELPAGAVDLKVEGADGERVVRLTLEESGARSAYLLGMGFKRPSTVVGVDDPASPAGLAGLTTGDAILTVNGTSVSDWLDLRDALAGVGDVVALDVVGEAGERTVNLRRSDWRALEPVDPMSDWGLFPATLFVKSVSASVGDDGFLSGCRPADAPPPSPAQLAGVEAGDRFLRLDGAPVDGWEDVLDAVGGTMEGEGDTAVARSLTVEVVRKGVVLPLSVTPSVIEDTNAMGDYYFRAIIGVYSHASYAEGPLVRRYYAFPQAASLATDQTLLIGRLIVEQIGKVLTGEASVEKSVGGPVEMVRQASRAAEKGLFSYAGLAAMLSLSLGIVNLLPVPILDGGQILFLLLEAVRGRPVSVQLRERAQQIGVLFMVLLMLSVLVMDINRLFQDAP